jgi:hypothetical protein
MRNADGLIVATAAFPTHRWEAQICPPVLSVMPAEPPAQRLLTAASGGPLRRLGPIYALGPAPWPKAHAIRKAGGRRLAVGQSYPQLGRPDLIAILWNFRYAQEHVHLAKRQNQAR